MSEHENNTEQTITDECNVAFILALKDAMNVINGKWKLAIIATMVKQPRRFNDIERLLQGITPRMISKELKELELNGVVAKMETIDPETGKKIAVYDLTKSGRLLEGLMVQMATWGQVHREMQSQ